MRKTRDRRLKKGEEDERQEIKEGEEDERQEIREGRWRRETGD